MSFFDDASLVMIPSGYKDQKVYSVKPIDGSGDLDFSRSNDTATRVNSAGLIEKVRTNLMTYSNDFSNAAWTKVRATLTSGQSDPFGGTNAWKMECSGSTGSVQIAQNANIGNGSIYAKAGNVSSFNVWVGLNVTFDLSSGTITSGAANGKIESVGGGWYRCTAINPSATVHNPNFTASSLGDYIYIAFAQGETGDIATDYIATTSSAVSVGPVANLPRLDYSGGATCPKLLLEPQRTNLISYSEQFNQWSDALGCDIYANTAVSPDGYTNADTLTFGSNADSRAFVTASNSSATYTFSVYAKSSTGKKFRFRISGSGGTLYSDDLTTTSEWQRFEFQYTSDVTAVGITNASTADAGSIFVYGFQQEVGAYATSYIPTIAAAVTRGADECSKTGISSLIGQTEGTIYFEYPNFNSDFNTGLVGIDDGSGNNRVLFYSDTNNRITAQVRTNGVTQQPSSYSVSGDVKVAIAYNSTGFVFYVNGTLRFTGTAVVFSDTMSVFTYNHVNIGSSITSQALLFKTRLSNSDLAALTS